MERNVNKLDIQTKLFICEKLDDNSGRGCAELATYLNIDPNILNSDTVLRLAGQDGKTVRELRKALMEIHQYDCVGIIDESIRSESTKVATSEHESEGDVSETSFGTTVSGRKLDDMDPKTREKLCMMLDDGGYKDLGFLFGMDENFLSKISQFSNPTERVLEWVQGTKPNVTMDDVREALSKMSRNDCVSIIDKNYFQEPTKDTTGERESEDVFKTPFGATVSDKSTAKLIANNGGMLETKSATLQFGPGCLSEDTEITMVEYDKYPPFQELTDSGLLDAPPLVLEFLPDGLKILNPGADLTIQLPWDTVSQELFVMHGSYDNDRERVIWKLVGNDRFVKEKEGFLRMTIHNFCFMSFFLSISSRLPRVICCVNCSFNCYAVGLYRREIQSQKLEVAVVIYSEFNENEPKQLRDLTGRPNQYKYTVAETGAMKCIETLSLKISLECPMTEKKEINVKLHLDQLMKGMVVDDFEGIDMEPPGSITMFIHDAKKQRLWKLQINESGPATPRPPSQEEATANEPSDEKSNTEILEVKWNQVSTAHKPKFEALVEVLKTNPKQCTRVGAYRVVCNEKFLIGNGCLGTQVFVGLSDDGREVAVKCLPHNLFKELGETEKTILMERPIQKEQHIVNYLHSELVNETGYLILHLCEQTLEEYVKKHSEKELKEQGPTIIRHVLLGLETLHCASEQTILHRDLKPSNVLVDCDGAVLLADFGISRALKKTQQTHSSVQRGAFGWMAAESISTGEDEVRDARYKTQSDIQVAGMLCFYVLTKGKHPYGPIWTKQCCNIEEGRPVNLDTFLVDHSAKDLISWMLQHNPNDRPSATECLNHPFLRPIDDQFDFITPIGNQQEIKTNDATSAVIQKLNCDPLLRELWLPKPNWKAVIDPVVMTYVSGKRNYTKDVADLLRFIRNTSEHWDDRPRPANVDCIVNHPKEYFLRLFPALPAFLHKVIRNYPAWKSREELKKFF